MDLLPARLSPRDVPRMVVSWPFVGALGWWVFFVAVVTIAGDVWPGGGLRAIAVGAMAIWWPQAVTRQLNRAAIQAVRAPACTRAPIRVHGPRRPVEVTVTRGIRRRMLGWLVLAALTAIAATTLAWRYRLTGPVDLAFDAGFVGVPLLVAWLIRLTLRRRAERMGDPAPRPVRVVGFTDPLARGLVLQPVEGGPRLAVAMAWKWRADLAVGDVLAWVGPWQGDRTTRAAWQARQVPVWVLCCPRRDYLVTTNRAFDPEPDPPPRPDRPDTTARTRIPGVLTRADIDARDGKTRP